MPTSLCITEVTSISDFMAFVEKKTQIRWYRGAGDSDHDLKPALYRHLSKTTSSMISSSK